jgi:hypothetical protein
MVLKDREVLPELYEQDETAWLERMAELIAEGRFNDLDYPHLREYLVDMAKRDRREVISRLSVLIAHRLKWDNQAEQRTSSWRKTIEVQRQELQELLESGTLRNHAVDSLAKAYANGLKQARFETGAAATVFPVESPYSVDALLADDWSEE